MKLWFLIYSLIFVFIGVIFVYLLGKVKLKDLNWWLFLVWGAASFELTLIIQPPMQKWWGQTFSKIATTDLTTMLFVLLPLALISGFVQESLKGIPFIFKRFLWVNQLLSSKKSWLSYSIAVGFAFAVWEAIRLVAYPVSFLTTLMMLPIIERVMAIMFHVASTPFLAYGIKQKKGIKYYLIVSIVHGLINYPVFLVQQGVISLNTIYYSGFTIVILFYFFTKKIWKNDIDEISFE